MPDIPAEKPQSAGFDPTTLAEEYIYLRITPHSIQAWREANELEHRQLMRRGEWLDWLAGAGATRP